MTYKLTPLPYKANALEPVIDEKTVCIHHDKHHQTYVDNLNKALEGTDLTDKSVEELLKDLDSVPEGKKTAVKNNGGGVYNHDIYWQSMTPGGSKEPVGKLKKAIDEKFGSFEAFKEAFEKAGAGQFGSGWVNLVSKDGELDIVAKSNQNSPVSDGMKVILLNDVWEHAYYLKYQNKRADYLKAWWDLVNWDIAEKRFNKK